MQNAKPKGRNPTKSKARDNRLMLALLAGAGVGAALATLGLGILEHVVVLGPLRNLYLHTLPRADVQYGRRGVPGVGGSEDKVRRRIASSSSTSSRAPGTYALVLPSPPSVFPPPLKNLDHAAGAPAALALLLLSSAQIHARPATALAPALAAGEIGLLVVLVVVVSGEERRAPGDAGQICLK
ncbi:hypothetical protein B0H14DRAFT_3461705 [Mycena olivaceomarginata]|nr:hypothetical protein B0H14DRAFT_3461705 [Mycena olivaceomarginata]